MENLFLNKNPLQDFLSSLNTVITTNKSSRIITGHEIYNPAYTYKFQLKTTQACSHCHVESSPKRKEVMSLDIADQCLSVLSNSPSISIVDLTGNDIFVAKMY